ncbi:PRC-barrel domain protein [Parvibaculum lavamentivorans DS-1]|uniref:PRC-barrel domain protein n=1 Tax=Parvibaculum lavamentivorans (strain DS-1 / DSM 13023 / NCIMB 13966) TaxID=402881 RepID=A7HP40_PARL1|nr:PRC-barrel domain-containing protein [Parvibaculum lavamentivorans]ABS61673.1 PRC-barrel domain protein [Parvibaculum lavamentivorans DS-1]
MKRLFTTTALVASMALGTAAASDSVDNAPREMAPPAQTEGAAMDANDNLETGSINSSDVVSINGNAAVMSDSAISARDLIGATVVGPTGDEVGSVSDLVFDDDNALEQVVVSDGGILGFGGKEVAVDFEGATVTRGEGDDPEVRIGMTAEAIEGVAEFDKTPYTDAGDRLGSAYIDREVRLASAEDRSGELHDLILDDSGAAKYAVVEFGGLLEIDSQLAVEIDSLTTASAEEPFSLSMTEEELRQAPVFHYDADDVASASDL